MARKFYPRATKYIKASNPHAEGTEYKVSVGDEEWGDGTFRSVVKVQMVYDGRYATYARAMNALQQDAAEKDKAGKENPINE